MDLTRVAADGSGRLICVDEWSLLLKDEQARMKPHYVDDINLSLNSSDHMVVEEITTRIDTRKRIIHDINWVMHFSQFGFEVDQLTVLNWAKRAVKITVKPDRTGKPCVFTGKASATNSMIRVRFTAVGLDSAEIQDSPFFPMSVQYGTIVRAWNLLSRFDQYIHRILLQKKEADLNTSIEAQTMQTNADNDALMLLSALNESSRYLYVYMEYKRQKSRVCKCSIIKW